MKNEMTHDDIINKEIEEEHEFMRARIKELENKPTYPFNEAFNKQLQEENAKLKQECKNLKEELRGCRIGIKNISIENTEICKISERYKRALDNIEQIAQTGLKPICYKSNCSRCKCYDGDNCKASVTEFLNYFFDDNGDMREDEDFGESLIALVDKERLKCNRAKPISEKILDIIHITRVVNNE